MPESLHRFFPVNFTKFLRIPIVIEHLGWLLLQVGPADAAKSQ